MPEIMYVDYIGIVGVCQVLLAYFLLQNNILKSADLIFSLLNLMGALMILYSLLFNWNLASVVIEIAWITISLQGIYQYYKNNYAQ